MSEVALVASQPIGNIFKYAVVVGDSQIYGTTYILAPDTS